MDLYIPGGPPLATPDDAFSSASSMSAGVVASEQSWASAPAALSGHHCFLPRTTFKSPVPGMISASALRTAGGDVLLGSNWTWVHTGKAVRHASQQRDIVYLMTATTPYPFQITADHILLIKGPLGTHVPEVARNLVGAQEPKFLFDGSCFHKISSASLVSECTEVVEVTLVGDASVLAWVFPKRANKKGRPEMKDDACVACLGARAAGTRCRLHDELELLVKNTFIDDPETCMVEERDPCRGRRPRSAPSRLPGQV